MRKPFRKSNDFVTALGKTITVAEDFPAFIVNRILLPMINEAIYTLYEGVGSVEAIDTAMKLGANHPMGPLQPARRIGLDTCLPPSCRFCTTGWRILSIARARFWSNMSKQAGWDARRVAAFTIIVVSIRFRRGKALETFEHERPVKPAFFNCTTP